MNLYIYGYSSVLHVQRNLLCENSVGAESRADSWMERNAFTVDLIKFYIAFTAMEMYLCVFQHVAIKVTYEYHYEV